MFVVRIILIICCIKFVVMAILYRQEGKLKSVWFCLGVALFWAILFAISFFVHI